jgi:N-acetylmuramoyl-L-alanine amidase
MNNRLVVNPGHFPEAPGAIWNNLIEYFEAKKVINKAIPMLKDYEFMESYGTLTQDMEKIKTFNPRFAIDVHYNAGKGTGPEVLIYPGSKNKDLLDLATSICESLSTYLNLKNRGVKDGWDRNNPDKPYYFLNELPDSGLIVELFFIDNPKDNKYLVNGEYIKIASALAVGIKRSFLISKEPELRE